MSTEIDLLVGEYLATHPEYEFPPSGDRHSSVLAIGRQMKPWLMDRLGGPLPYWRAMLESAKVWFPQGCQSREFRIFCTLFEADGNTFWNGHLELEALAREYNVWRRDVQGL
jgi:hypothetical protein